jgi:Transposase DDE domain
VILNDRLDRIKKKTPDLNELHTDGAYGSEQNDKDMEQLGITHVQTAVRGCKAGVAIEIEELCDDQYIVHCPHQSVRTQKTKKYYKACFDPAVCKQCSLAGRCSVKKTVAGRVYYFDRADYLKNKRNRNIKTLPPERRKLRPNVEATVKEFTKPFNHKGKLKIRGKFKTMLYAFSMGIAINFGRVWRYRAENPGCPRLLRQLYLFLLGLCSRQSRYWCKKRIILPKNSCRVCLQQHFKQAA